MSDRHSARATWTLEDTRRASLALLVLWLVLTTLLVVVGRQGKERAAPDEAAPARRGEVTKTVVMKASPTEQRRGFDLLSRSPLQERPVTVYYLVAGDGTAVEVPLGVFAAVEPGDEFASDRWVSR
jgi:hypothetical protein